MSYVPGDKIGEYIHSKYENYLNFGLARNFGTSHMKATKQGDLTSFLNDARQRSYAMFASNKDAQFIKLLENQISYIMKPEENSGIGDYKDLRQAVFKHMQQFVANLDENDIDWNTLSLKPSATKKLQKISKEELANVLGDNALSTSTLQSSSLGKSGQTYTAAFWRQIKNLNAAINVLSQKASNQAKIGDLSKTLASISKQAVALGWGKSGLQQGNGSLVKELRALAREVIKSASLAQFEGELGEAVVAQASSGLAGAIEDGYKNIVGTVVGSIKGKNIYIEKSFMNGLDVGQIIGQRGFQRGTNSTEEIVWQTKSDVKGKIDVSIEVDEKEINANIKNYRLNSTKPYDIKMVRGTNMLYLFQNQSRFLNHYLNQTASTSPLGVTMQANQIMKQMLLLSSFTGGGARTDITSGKQANVFVINNKSTGTVKIVPIYKLFDTIIRNNKKLNGVDINLPDGQQWNNTYIKATDYSPSATSIAAVKRITTLLQAVRKYKIDVVIKSGYIKQLLQI